MHILFLLTRNADATLETIIEENRRQHLVTVLNLNSERDYKAIIALIDSCDQVISW